ncbi:trehalose-6-phosphate synthase [soil metagenome]
MAERPVVIVSNRGPLSFRDEGGELVARRGAGGLVSGLVPVVAGTGTTWIAAAISDGDRQAAGRGLVDAEGFRVRLLDIDPPTYRMAYNVICNATLWFLHHGLFDLARRPRIDGRWWAAWAAYRAMNLAFADAVVADAPDEATVLVQDYHLTLLGPDVCRRRPDLRTVHFAHTPFASPDLLRVLPAEPRRELLEGLAGHGACGFHTRRWADTFTAGCVAELGRAPATFVAPLGPDPSDIKRVAASPACADALSDLDTRLAGRRLIARVDRIELSKNLLRGFHAFADLLARYPEWREQVVFGAFVYPSREGLPEYLAYRQEVEGLVRQINERWATPGWTPVLLDATDDFPRSVAALRRYDVLLVNPISDGLNLVAKEGVLANEHDGVLVLSPEAGAFAELGEHALAVHPYDVGGTADGLHRALTLPADDRHRRAAHVRSTVAARTPADWLADQLSAVPS